MPKTVNLGHEPYFFVVAMIALEVDLQFRALWVSDIRKGLWNHLVRLGTIMNDYLGML